MIICCHSEITRQWDGHELSGKLGLLSPGLQEVAMRKRRLIDRQLFIAGKVLIPEILKNLGVKGHSFNDLKYNIHKRPYFDSGVDFNISHYGNLVICCGITHGMIGVDIEQIKTGNLDEYPDYFTSNEWEYIYGHTDKLEGFFNLWSRKEAVLKAIGTGFHTPLNSVDVVKDIVEYDDIIYHIQPVGIAPKNPRHKTTTIKDEIKLIPIEL